jgi:hypothetical protein
MRTFNPWLIPPYEDAEADALFAIDYAYATIEQAEYSVLDAIAARMEADDLAAAR